MKGSRQPRQGAFISYARADGEPFARALHARLQLDAPDVPAWLDRYDIEGGVGWWNQIEQELDRAEFLLIVMTPAAFRSENTRNEWRSARQRGVCVYPIKGVPDSDLDYESLPNWMRKAQFYDPDAEWQKLIAHLRRGCRAHRVPFMAPPLAASFVPRPRESDHLVDALLGATRGERSGVAVALRGGGGFGKSTLAAAVCHDDRTLDTFDDGILWVTLGQAPNLLNELVKLYAAVSGERPGFVDVEDAARELALRLDGKNCLLVIDDAWNAAHLRPFLQGGRECARLITTRLFDVAAQFQRIDVDRMTTAEALQLLHTRAGASPPDIAEFHGLIERLGEWPLAITLAGSAMRQRMDRGDTIAGAMDYVNRALVKRGISAFDRQETTAREEAVARTVAASFDLLAAEDQRRCAELTIFPPSTAIALKSATAVWGLDEIDGEDLARRLDDLALAQFDLRRGVVRVHDVLRTFLADRVPDPPGVHARLLEHWGDPYSLTDVYAWRTIAFHLNRAGRTATLRRLLLDPKWLDAKLRATDIHGLIADFEYAENDRTLELVRDALRLAAPMLAADPTQLRAQLLARLQLSADREIVSFRLSAREASTAAWLQLLHPTVDAPGGQLLTTLVGHDAAVTSLVVDRTWRWLASGSEDATIRIWNPVDGQLTHVLDNHDTDPRRRSARAAVRALAVTRSGELVLAGAADGFIYVWDAVRSQPLRRFSREAGGAITAVAVSSDGRIAVSSAREDKVRVWEVSGRSLLHTLTGHSERVTAVAISADGKHAVSASDDCTVRVWDVAAGALERTFEGHGAGVNAVAMTDDGRFVLSGSSDRTVRLWSARTGECVRTLSGYRAGVTAVALTPDGRRAIVGTSDWEVSVWNLHDGRLLAGLAGHSDSISSVCIDDAGNRAATCSADRTVKLWRLDAAGALPSIDVHTGSVMAVAFSPDGRLCASSGDDGCVKIRDVESGRIVRTIDGHRVPVRSLAFTADGTCVLSASVDGRCWLWTVDDGAGTWIPARHGAPVDCFALSGVARYLTTACADRFVYIWDVPSGGLLDRYGTRRLFNHLITPSPRRRTLPAVDEYLDSYLAGESVYEVLAVSSTGDGEHVAFSARGRDHGGVRTAPRQAGGDVVADNGCLLVLNVRTGEIRSVVIPQREPARAFAVDANATRVLWASSDHSLELWDLPTSCRITTLRGHSERVNAICFSADGTRAFSCASDRTVRVWSLDGGREIATFTTDAALRSIATTPRAGGESVIAAGDVAGRVHLLLFVPERV